MKDAIADCCAVAVILILCLWFAAAHLHAQPTIRVTNDSLKNIGIARDLKWALSLIPNSDSLDWTITVEPHNEFQAHHSMAGHKFPQRCVTYTAKRETVCDADWVQEFSGMAKAGTLAHEYGHILCGREERDADSCGAQLMRGVALDAIRPSAQ